MYSARLPQPADFDAWRNHARALLASGIEPADVTWLDGGADEDLFADMQTAAPLDPGTPLSVPRRYAELARAAICHSDPARFALLYRLLWRIVNENRALLSVATDPDVARTNKLAKAVRRDSHKMKAFVRFRAISDQAGEAFVAWFEPDHHIVERTAPFFARRFTGMRWSILTPRRSAHWDGKHLSFTDGARKSDVPDADALDAHWRAYYSAIFNPARVKLKAMQAEMPKKYWKNLPEAGLIANLTRDAGRRAAGMLEAEPTAPARKGRVALPDRHARSLPGLDEAASLPELAAACRVCRACALCGPATQAVFGEGPADARLMIVGEQPGDREDLEGRPFVGPAGALLDELLDEAGVAREAVYLTNAVKHFGFERRGKRRLHKTAKTAEADECLPWLEKEIAFVKPRAILAMGRTSARVLFGPGLKVTEVRGRAMPTRQGPSGLVTFHPAYILRQRDRGAAARARAALSDDLRAALELANGAVATAA